jgi:hypothetical protein
MDPAQLREWEPILQSQVAVSLLLLAALIGSLAWSFTLYRTNQALQREFREHLRAQGDFRGVLEHAREAIALVRETGGDGDRETVSAD